MDIGTNQLFSATFYLVLDDATAEELRLQRTTNRTDGLRELLHRALVQVGSVLGRLSGSGLLTTELRVEETARTADPVTGNTSSRAVRVNNDVSDVLHDVDYYGTIWLTCKLFLTEG